MLLGLKRGAQSFAQTVVAETLHVTAQIAMTAQSLLELVDHSIAGTSYPLGGSAAVGVSGIVRRSRWSGQPRTAREGFQMVRA